MEDEATLEELCEEDMLVTSPMMGEEDESIPLLRAEKKMGRFLISRVIFLLTSIISIIIYTDIAKGSGLTHPGFFWTLVALDIVMLFVLVFLIYRRCCRPLGDPDPESVTLEEIILNL